VFFSTHSFQLISLLEKKNSQPKNRNFSAFVLQPSIKSLFFGKFVFISIYCKVSKKNSQPNNPNFSAFVLEPSIKLLFFGKFVFISIYCKVSKKKLHHRVDLFLFFFIFKSDFTFKMVWMEFATYYFYRIWKKLEEQKN